MIVAKVNDYEIKFQEYQAELDAVLKNMHLQEPNEEAKKRAIEQLIDGYLLLNSAQKSDVNITEDDIEHELVEIKLKYDTENDFHQMLNSNQIDIDVIKNRIKSNLLIAKYIKNNFSVNTDIPLEKLLIETDSPFLAPIPMRGKKNEPSFIKYTLLKLAELKNISNKEMETISTNNFNNLFF